MFFCLFIYYFFFLFSIESSSLFTNNLQLKNIPGNFLSSIRGGKTNQQNGNVMIIHDSIIFDLELEKSKKLNKLVVIDFSAKWCPPCKMIAPIFDELSSQYDKQKVTFLKVDVDDLNEIATRYQIKSMPTFLFIKDKKVVDRFSGANVELLQKTIQKFIN